MTADALNLTGFLHISLLRTDSSTALLFSDWLVLGFCSSREQFNNSEKSVIIFSPMQMENWEISPSTKRYSHRRHTVEFQAACQLQWRVYSWSTAYRNSNNDFMDFFVCVFFSSYFNSTLFSREAPEMFCWLSINMEEKRWWLTFHFPLISNSN